MKVHLMFRDRDFDAETQGVPARAALAEDLELKAILSAMAGNDKTVEKSAGAALFQTLTDADAIAYRQAAVRDALSHPAEIRALCALAAETLEKKKGMWHWLSVRRDIDGTYSDAVALLKEYLVMLRRLRKLADTAAGYRSEAFLEFWDMLKRDLSDGYLDGATALVAELSAGGMLISARLGSDLSGADYALRRKNRKYFRFRWAAAPRYSLAPRDDAGASELQRRRQCAVNESANALAQAAAHIEAFFGALMCEAAFFVGCLNLSDRLAELGMQICFPAIEETRRRTARGLYDAALPLVSGKQAVGSDLSTAGAALFVVTGANQGGKSTFLRAVGQAQMMFQSGMFVAAEQYASHVCRGVFTHFKREEDRTMASGKLDEELARMDEIADRLERGALILFNESFAATNEREGAEICRQIALALAESGVEVFFVTHLFAFADAMRRSGRGDIAFYRAERRADGARTFRIVPGAPEPTAFGGDLYEQVFGKAAGL